MVFIVLKKPSFHCHIFITFKNLSYFFTVSLFNSLSIPGLTLIEIVFIIPEQMDMFLLTVCIAVLYFTIHIFLEHLLQYFILCNQNINPYMRVMVSSDSLLSLT